MEVIKQLTEQVQAFREENKNLLKQANEAKAVADGIAKEYKEKVDALNADLAAKGATIAEMQEAVKELKAKSAGMGGGEMKVITSVEDLIAKSFEKEEAQAVLKSGRIGEGWTTDPLLPKTPFRAKAAGTIVVNGSPSNVTGATIVGVPTWSNEIWGRGYDDLHFRDIFSVMDSATGVFTFYRGNTPAGEGSIAKITQPGSDKPLIDKDVTLQTVTAYYRAGVADVAKESLQDLPMLQSYLNEELVNDYLDKETYDSFVELLAAASGNNSVVAGNDFVIEDIIDLIKNQRKAKYRADRLITTPDIWAEILKTRPNDFSLPNAVTITPNGSVAIVGIPIVTVNTNAFAERQILVGDSRKARLMQVTGEGLKLETFRQHDKAVYNNIVSFRVEARTAPIVFRTDAFIKATLPTHS